jgi:hypothetical protein
MKLRTPSSQPDLDEIFGFGVSFSGVCEAYNREISPFSQNRWQTLLEVTHPR